MPAFDVATASKGIEVDKMINAHPIQNGLLLEGELNFISLADVFQILGGNNSTGVLHLSSPYAEAPAEVYFVDGNPINAAFGSLNGLDAIYALFGWTEGDFEFRQEEKNPGQAFDHSRMQIVLDALRMLDDGMIKTVGPPHFVDPSSSPSNKTGAGAEGSLLVIKGPLVDYMYIVQEEYLSDGDRLVTEGAYGNWVWVILEGRVKITRDTRRGPLALAQLGNGCFIGTFTSFLFSDYVRTATVTAIGDVHLGLLDTQRLAGEFASLSNDFRKFLLALSAKLKTVSDKTIYLIGEGARDQESGTGRHLVSEGSLSNEEIMFYDKAIRSPSTDKPEDALLPMTPLHKRDILKPFLFNPLQSDTDALSGIHSKEHESESINMEKMRREYEGLSRTFKNMMDYLAACIATTTTLACQLDRDRKLLTEKSGKPLT